MGWFIADTADTIMRFELFGCQGRLQTLLEYIKDKDADKVSVGLASTLDTIAELELLQVSKMANLFSFQLFHAVEI